MEIIQIDQLAKFLKSQSIEELAYKLVLLQSDQALKTMYSRFKIVKHLERGKTSRAIASRLHVSKGTVTNVSQKMRRSALNL